MYSGSPTVEQHNKRRCRGVLQTSIQLNVLGGTSQGMVLDAGNRQSRRKPNLEASVVFQPPQPHFRAWCAEANVSP
jgi:hypothetical protein